MKFFYVSRPRQPPPLVSSRVGGGDERDGAAASKIDLSFFVLNMNYARLLFLRSARPAAAAPLSSPPLTISQCISARLRLPPPRARSAPLLLHPGLV